MQINNVHDIRISVCLPCNSYNLSLFFSLRILCISKYIFMTLHIERDILHKIFLSFYLQRDGKMNKNGKDEYSSCYLVRCYSLIAIITQTV